MTGRRGIYEYPGSMARLTIRGRESAKAREGDEKEVMV